MWICWIRHAVLWGRTWKWLRCALFLCFGLYLQDLPLLGTLVGCQFGMRGCSHGRGWCWRHQQVVHVEGEGWVSSMSPWRDRDNREVPSDWKCHVCVQEVEKETSRLVSPWEHHGTRPCESCFHGREGGQEDSARICLTDLLEMWETTVINNTSSLCATVWLFSAHQVTEPVFWDDISSGWLRWNL